MKVKEIMTEQVELITTNDTVKTAASKMKELNVGDLPVVVGGDVVGMITDRDIAVRSTAKGLDPEKSHVIDVMTKDVVACREEDDLEAVADMMGKYKVRRLVVMKGDNELCGVVALRDMALNLDKAAAGRILQEISL